MIDDKLQISGTQISETAKHLLLITHTMKGYVSFNFVVSFWETQRKELL